MKEAERRHRHSEVEPAADAVGRLLDGYHLTEVCRQHRIALEWSQIVGPRIAARTKPGTLDEGVLHVRVSNSSWMHQLSFLRTQLIEQINAALGDPPVIQEIRFHLGMRSRTGDQPNEAPGPTAVRRQRPRPRPLPEPASGAALRAIEDEAGAIEDPELRALVIEARRRVNR